MTIEGTIKKYGRQAWKNKLWILVGLLGGWLLVRPDMLLKYWPMRTPFFTLGGRARTTFRKGGIRAAKVAKF